MVIARHQRELNPRPSCQRSIIIISYIVIAAVMLKHWLAATGNRNLDFLYQFPIQSWLNHYSPRKAIQTCTTYSKNSSSFQSGGSASLFYFPRNDSQGAFRNLLGRSYSESERFWHTFEMVIVSATVSSAAVPRDSSGFWHTYVHTELAKLYVGLGARVLAVSPWDLKSTISPNASLTAPCS